jgi:hypothetical protein
MKAFFWDGDNGNDVVIPIDIPLDVEKIINKLTDPSEIMAFADSAFDIRENTDQETIDQLRQAFIRDAEVEDIGSGILASKHRWEGGYNYLYLSTTGQDELAEIIAKKEIRESCECE